MTRIRALTAKVAVDTAIIADTTASGTRVGIAPVYSGFVQSLRWELLGAGCRRRPSVG